MAKYRGSFTSRELGGTRTLTPLSEMLTSLPDFINTLVKFTYFVNNILVIIDAEFTEIVAVPLLEFFSCYIGIVS